jgi:hypothetical protein
MNLQNLAEPEPLADQTGSEPASLHLLKAESQGRCEPPAGMGEKEGSIVNSTS